MMEASYNPLGQAVAHLRNFLIKIFTRKDKIKFWCLGVFCLFVCFVKTSITTDLQYLLLIHVINRYLSMCNHYIWFLRHAVIF